MRAWKIEHRDLEHAFRRSRKLNEVNWRLVQLQNWAGIRASRPPSWQNIDRTLELMNLYKFARRLRIRIQLKMADRMYPRKKKHDTR